MTLAHPAPTEWKETHVASANLSFPKRNISNLPGNKEKILIPNPDLGFRSSFPLGLRNETELFPAPNHKSFLPGIYPYLDKPVFAAQRGG
jgi:hypothetical protein